MPTRANSNVPVTIMTSASSNAQTGENPVEMATSSTGARVKVSSSVMDSRAKAASSLPEPPSMCAQRARTIEPICGTEAPTSAATTTSARAGAWVEASRSSVPSAAACRPTCGNSTFA